MEWKNLKKEQLELIVKESINKSDVLRNLGLKNNGGNFNTLNKYVNIYNIDISHFKRSINEGNKNFIKIPLDEILIENSSYLNTSSLKNRLYNEGFKDRKCEFCGQDEEWNGKKISLIIDHINGIRNDNRLENLRILCPNCNATLDTHCGKNARTIPQKIKNYRKNKVINKCSCGNVIA